MDEQRPDNQLQQLYAGTGCSLEDLPQEQWTIEMGGKRGSGKSMLQHDDIVLSN